MSQYRKDNGMETLYFESDNEYKLTIKQAKNLPNGWTWYHYEDGSGSLRSPDEKEHYFSYDKTTNEYKKTKDSHWEYEMPSNFEEVAEAWVSQNILKSKENMRMEDFLIQYMTSSETLQESFDKIVAAEKAFHEITGTHIEEIKGNIDACQELLDLSKPGSDEMGEMTEEGYKEYQFHLQNIAIRSACMDYPELILEFLEKTEPEQLHNFFRQQKKNEVKDFMIEQDLETGFER